MILIGSKAIKEHYPDFPREPKDTDYIIRDNKEILYKRNDVEFLKNPIISNLYKNDDYYVIEPNMLCTLKASHLCWNINWEKHMFDLQFLLKKGNKIDKELFLELYNYWNHYHGKNKRSDLKMSKDEFFDNAVNYDTLEHDQMHLIINPVPIYTKVLKDGAEVELDENKFFNLSHEDKLEFVREEVMVMGWERYRHLDYRVAFNNMLKKFIISHAPMFSLIFILENYIELQTKPKFNFIKLINEKINGTKI